MTAPGNMLSGTTKLPSPSTATITVAGGVATIPNEDTDIAISLGWQLLASENYANRAQRMTRPVTAAWPASGILTFPDGTTAAITAGVAKIPGAWINWATNHGWQA